MLVNRSQLAKELGVSYSTIQVWEGMGVITPALHIGTVIRYDIERAKEQAGRWKERKRKPRLLMSLNDRKRKSSAAGVSSSPTSHVSPHQSPAATPIKEV